MLADVLAYRNALCLMCVGVLGLCRDLKVQGGAVFWPTKAQQPEAEWIGASDHRAVYLDVEVCGGADGAAVI